MSDELRECPCGGYGTLYSGRRFLLECHKCGRETKAYATKAEAVVAWNIGILEDLLAAKDKRIAELEAALWHCLDNGIEAQDALWRDAALAALRASGGSNAQATVL